MFYKRIFVRSCLYSTNILKNYCNRPKQLVAVTKLSNYGGQRNFGYHLKCVLIFCTGYMTYKLFNKDYLIPNVAAASTFSSNLKDRRRQFNFVADVVEHSASAVVYIEIKDTRRRDFFTGKPTTISNGSGFIIKEDGLILTNAHVVANKPHSKVEVRLNNGLTYNGHVEDIDLKSDLATVRIAANKLPVIKLGNSSDLRPGEFVVAIGSPLALSNTVTFGVISSTSRASEELGLKGRDMVYLQTDAAITFGNSGGPLVNLDGEAIGVNSMKVTAGISFAIPSDYVKEFLKSVDGVKKTGVSEHSRRYMGITMLTLTPQILHELHQRNQYVPTDIKGGVLVWKVILGSPAHSGGLQPGDIVTHIDGKQISGANDVYAVLTESTTRTIAVTVIRSGKTIELYVTPENIN